MIDEGESPAERELDYIRRKKINVLYLFLVPLFKIQKTTDVRGEYEDWIIIFSWALRPGPNYFATSFSAH